MVHFWGDGKAQSLFSKFTAYQSLESTCIGLIGRKLYCFSDMPIQLAATNRLHHHPPWSLNNEYWLSVYQITTKDIYCRRKCQHMLKNMRYAHFAKICEKCGKVPNMRQSHIRVFLTYLFNGWCQGSKDDCGANNGEDCTFLLKMHFCGYMHVPVINMQGIWMNIRYFI